MAVLMVAVTAVSLAVQMAFAMAGLSVAGKAVSMVVQMVDALADVMVDKTAGERAAQ